MKRFSIAVSIAGLAALAVVLTASAADPTPGPGRDPVRARDTIPAVLGLSWEEVRDLRHAGLTLAEIAERQKVDPQALVDMLVARWTDRIEARVGSGSLTADRAATLKAQLATRAEAMVYREPFGPGHGSGTGVGNGPWNGNGPRQGGGPWNGNGAGGPHMPGSGTCAGMGVAAPSGN